MLFFNIPILNIFDFEGIFHHGHASHYERPIELDPRNGALLQPLEENLFRLEDIRVRMGTRIEKEIASGTDMNAAISLLRSADDTLSYAEQAVAIATSTVTSSHPHPGYLETENAYQALNLAKEALSGVLQAIETAADAASTTPPVSQ